MTKYDTKHLITYALKTYRFNITSTSQPTAKQYYISTHNVTSTSQPTAKQYYISTHNVTSTSQSIAKQYYISTHNVTSTSQPTAIQYYISTHTQNLQIKHNCIRWPKYHCFSAQKMLHLDRGKEIPRYNKPKTR